MAVKDLDTPLHRLMFHLEGGEYAMLTDEFNDFVKQDFDERVQEVQSYTKDKHSFLFIKSFIEKVRRKQYDAARVHLQAVRQLYQKFMLQYESFPDRKKQPAINPNPQPNVNEPRPAVISNVATNRGNMALRPAKSPPPAYTPRLQNRINVSVRPESIPTTVIDERLQPPIERESPRPRQDVQYTGRPAIFTSRETSSKPIEKERKRQREFSFSDRSHDEDKLITPWKHVREFNANRFLFNQNRVPLWLPAPEDVRPNFVSRVRDYDKNTRPRDRFGLNSYSQSSPSIRDSHLYSDVYDTFKQSPEPSIIRSESQLQLENLYNSQRPSKLELTTRGMKERNIVFYLLQIVTEAYEHCRTAVELNLNEKPKPKEETSENSGSSDVSSPEFQVHPNLEQKRTKAAKLLPYAREDFIQKTYPDILPRKILTECLRTKAYAEKSMEVCWWMCVREPPITMEWVPERANDQPYQTFHRAIYDPYTQGGSHLDFTVWPAIRLYEQGPILSKGIAQGITPK
ncbi:hypothetical protein ACJMK2_031152 [Sinanodonta woodiana]|uniref:Mitochondria-eating protein C-terminal domain-containing protein n=1 Tax=Sinanodonta woodiana TaxID=1069815 RepID=A0ABD3WXX9_SINWO